MSYGQIQKDRNLTTEIINVTINPKKKNKIREGFIKSRSKEKGKLNRKKEIIEWKVTKRRGKKKRDKKRIKKREKKIYRKKENGN